MSKNEPNKKLQLRNSNCPPFCESWGSRSNWPTTFHGLTSLFSFHLRWSLQPNRLRSRNIAITLPAAGMVTLGSFLSGGMSPLPDGATLSPTWRLMCPAWMLSKILIFKRTAKKCLHSYTVSNIRVITGDDFGEARGQGPLTLKGAKYVWPNMSDCGKHLFFGLYLNLGAKFRTELELLSSTKLRKKVSPPRNLLNQQKIDAYASNYE